MFRTDFVEQARVPRWLWTVILFVLAGSGCTSAKEADEIAQPVVEQAATPDPGSPQASTRTPAIIEHEPAPRTDVAILWRDRDKMVGTVLSESQVLVVDLKNSLDRTVTGRLVLVTAGLDGRLERRPLESFSLAAGMSREAQIPVGKLAIQSEASTSLAAVTAEVDRPKGTVRVSTQPIYYRFQNGYREAKFYNVQEAGSLPDQGLATQDPMDVQGRIIEANGAITNAAELAARADQEAKKAGKGRQGLAGFGRAPIDPATNEVVHPFPLKPAPRAATDSLASPIPGTNVCSTWLTDFIDAGYGEDYLSGGYAFVPAKHAHAYIIDAWWNVYWQGNLDSQGCTGTVSLSPGTYYLYQVTTGIGRDNKWFNSYYVSNGSPTTTYILPSFYVYTNATSVTVYDWFNDSAIQAAAVAGQFLAQDAAEPGGMGITPGWPFDIRTNEGCSGANPPTDSCYESPSSSLPHGAAHIGTTPTGGYTDDRWKFTIGHELGHYLSDIAMGIPNMQGYDGNSVITLCTCDHYDTSWSNKEHCIQSVEYSGAAQFEGLAHMFASRAFNRTSDWDAVFVYYKPFRQIDWDIAYPPVAFDTFNPAQWRNVECGGGYGYGVEMDWMTFFYDVTQGSWSDVTSVADLYAIYRGACTGIHSLKCLGQTVDWSALSNSAGNYYGFSNSKYVRFDSTGWDTGVAD